MARRYTGDKNKQVIFRCSEPEKDRLTLEAKAAGLSTSDYIRTKVFAASTPDHVAATYAATNNMIGTLNQMESAIAQARRTLSGEEG